MLTVKFITTGYLDNNAYQTKLIDTLENLNLTIGLYKLLTDNISIIKTNKAEELNEIIVKIYEYFNNIITIYFKSLLNFIIQI